MYSTQNNFINIRFTHIYWSFLETILSLFFYKNFKILYLMKFELLILNGYGQFVWPAFMFTFVILLFLFFRIAELTSINVWHVILLNSLTWVFVSYHHHRDRPSPQRGWVQVEGGRFRPKRLYLAPTEASKRPRLLRFLLTSKELAKFGSIHQVFSRWLLFSVSNFRPRSGVEF